MSRKLASVRKIIDIQEIPNADAIEVATVDGWEVVVKKGEFKIGDLACYFEIDSFLPETKQFEFLKKSCSKRMNGVNGYRLKTIKLRKQLSQGLLLPLSEFNIKNAKEGQDLTDKLGVKLYQSSAKQISAHKQTGAYLKFVAIKNAIEKIFPKSEIFFRFIGVKFFGLKFAKRFPSFIKKTDQERIQNLAGRIDEFRDIPFEVTVKLDGSSLTIFKNRNKTGICSRNFDVSEEDNNYTKINKKYGIIDALNSYNRNIAIQGEMIGPSIQGNPEGINEVDFYVFDIYDIDKNRHMTRIERHETLKDLHFLHNCTLNHVPTIRYNFKLEDMSLEDILNMSEGKSLYANKREGLVFKSMEPVGNRIFSFKAISNSYLMKLKD